uniref:Uncharacterized protein n=1 Tax=Steinernema glaseri TaxID=37863 RepID=A0A1I8AKY9_9BILA
MSEIPFGETFPHGNPHVPLNPMDDALSWVFQSLLQYLCYDALEGNNNGQLAHGADKSNKSKTENLD